MSKSIISSHYQYHCDLQVGTSAKMRKIKLRKRHDKQAQSNGTTSQPSSCPFELANKVDTNSSQLEDNKTVVQSQNSNTKAKPYCAPASDTSPLEQPSSLWYLSKVVVPGLREIK